MKIVADEHRKREFEQVTASRVFEEIKPLVEFSDYGQLVIQYDKHSIAKVDIKNYEK